MKHAVATSAFAAALQMYAVKGALSPRQSEIIINTPTNLQTCLVSQITWSGGVPPFIVQVFPEGQQTGALVTFPEAQAPPIKWEVNVPAGASYTLGIRDADGNTNAAAPAAVSEGTSDDCVGQDTTGGGGSTGGGSSGSPSSPAGTSGGGSSDPEETSADSGDEPSETSAGSAPEGSAPAEGDGGDSGAGMLKAGAATLVLGALSALF